MGPLQHRRRNDGNKEWTCCFGMHVLTATIMIGLWHLFLNIIALSLLAAIMRNPQMVNELHNHYDYTVDMSAPALPTPLSKVDPPYAYRDHSLNYHSYDMGGLVCTCMIVITMMMLYGAIQGKPSHLLPFFCLQLFDFAITTLTAAGYICYLQAIQRLINESHRLPWREKLLELTPDELVVVVLIVFVCIVCLKAYAIGIVWRCYKYLTMMHHTTLALNIPTHTTSGSLAANERSYSTLLPNYEEAVIQYLKQAPPPSYQVAMSNLQSPSTVTPAGQISSTPAANVALPNILEEDNNNDTSNNNNTLHFNANTSPKRHADESLSTNNSSTPSTPPPAPGTIPPPPPPPPAYNEVIITTQQSNAANSNNSNDVNINIPAMQSN